LPIFSARLANIQKLSGDDHDGDIVMKGTGGQLHAVRKGIGSFRDGPPRGDGADSIRWRVLE
jgi:hypothetical protein